MTKDSDQLYLSHLAEKKSRETKGLKGFLFLLTPILQGHTEFKTIFCLDIKFGK